MQTNKEKETREQKKKAGLIRLPFYLLGMFLTSPGKGLYLLSGKIRSREDLEKAENICGVLLAIAFFNLSGFLIDNVWIRAIVAIFVAFLLIEVFDYIVFSADRVRGAIRYYMGPLAKRYDHYLDQIVLLVAGKERKKETAGSTGREQTNRERARQEQARQERTKQERAKQERARQEQARQERTRQERARQERARQERTRQERTRREHAGQEQMGHKPLTPYDEALNIFNVREPFTAEEIKSKRNLLLKSYHPDNNNGSEEMCKKINECYELLMQHIS